MPRRRDPDDEDMMATCPQCNGGGEIEHAHLDEAVLCPLCNGTGRVVAAVYDRYTRGLLADGST